MTDRRIELLISSAGLTVLPARRLILLALAQADGQPWTEDQTESGWTDHMAEVMYGDAADALDSFNRTVGYKPKPGEHPVPPNLVAKPRPRHDDR